VVPQAVDDRNNDITFFVIHEYYKDKKERYIQNLVQSSLNHYSQQTNQANGQDDQNRSSSTQNTEQTGQTSTTGQTTTTTFGPNLPPNSGTGFTPMANTFQPSGGLQPTANTFTPTNSTGDNQQSGISTDNNDQTNLTGNIQPKSQQFE
jgi:hypothetical protein